MGENPARLAALRAGKPTLIAIAPGQAILGQLYWKLGSRS